jgi:hypothetical protein
MAKGKMEREKGMVIVFGKGEKGGGRKETKKQAILEKEEKQKLQEDGREA